MFDHDKGQKSALSGRRLPWILLNLLQWISLFSGKKQAHKHKLFGPVALGTSRECPGDKPGLSPAQSVFVPGTNPGFLLTLHSGSPVCPGDIPGTKSGRKSLCVKSLCAFFVP